MAQTFEDEILTRAHALIVQRRHAEAKVLLLQIPDNQKAKEWLAKIAEIERGDPFVQLGQIPPEPNKPKRFLGSSPRAWMFLMVFICFCCIVPALFTRPSSVSLQPTKTFVRSLTPRSTTDSDDLSPIQIVEDTLETNVSTSESTGADTKATATRRNNSTSTKTPLPATVTRTSTPDATEKAMVRIENATATAEELMFIRTQQSEDKTATADSRQATKDFIASFKPIARRELVSYADNHIGEKVVIKGRVFNIVNSRELQLMLAGSSSDAVYIESSTSFSGIYENDFVTVYATVLGYVEGTNAFGGTIR